MAPPGRLPVRGQRDAGLQADVRQVFNENFQVYGVHKVWQQSQRESIPVARRTVARLMREMGLRGVIRGKPVKTTITDKTLPCPLDRVKRQFRADRPDQLWLSDFTYVSTWSGFVYVAFVIDAFARRIVAALALRARLAGFPDIRAIRRRTRLRLTSWPCRRRCRVICRLPYQGVSRNCSSISRINSRFAGGSPLAGP